MKMLTFSGMAAARLKSNKRGYLSLAIGVFLSILAFLRADVQLSLVGAILIGATLGFLLYNFYPARVFMGDTGSLFLGALIVGATFQAKIPLSGLLVCGVFIIELLSSALQIGYFKMTKGKRLFKMAPIHHHFEQCGWSENTVVLVFSLVELLFCVLAYFTL